MKKVFLLLMFMGLASLTLGERVWAYSSLFASKGLLQYDINDKSQDNLDSWDTTGKYFGYTGDDYKGYYIGTILNVNTDNGQVDHFDAIIAYYLGNNSYTVEELKVQYSESQYSGTITDDDSGISLTVRWQQDLKSGTWSLNNAYGFGFYAVKGGNDFALYFVDPAENSGTWTTRHLEVGNPNNPNHPEISHLSGAPTLVHAPEPSSLLLLGCGLLGLSAVVRRRGQ